MASFRTRGSAGRDRLADDLLSQLYDEHAPGLLSYALRLTAGDRQRAEDVVQETLLRAWRNPGAVTKDGASPGSWLRTVARNVAFDAHRARRARPQEVGSDALESAASPDDGIDRALEAWVVADALAALSPAHREVIVQTFYRGRSVAEAAQALGVPPGTVKSRTYYALRELRGLLVERGVIS